MYCKKSQREELKDAFELFDTEKTGIIDYAELRVIIKALGFENITKQDVFNLAREYDISATGRIPLLDYFDLSIIISDETLR